MSGFVDEGYERYVAAIREQYLVAVRELESAALLTDSAEQSAALRREAQEVLAELERRLRHAQDSFF